MSEDQLSAVMGATKTLRTYVDGSLVIQLEIEPRHAQQAFALFGAPGTPIALARITNEAAVEQDRANTAKLNNTAKGGALARLAAQLCQDPQFHEFVADNYGVSWHINFAEEDITHWLREQCGIESRAELDSNEEAADHFHTYIRRPWLQWRAARGLK